jgi:hypothetical protein
VCASEGKVSVVGRNRSRRRKAARLQSSRTEGDGHCQDPGPGRRKMSAVLVDVAEPLLADLHLPEHEDGYRLALMIAAGVWNASRQRTESERSRAFADVWESLEARFQSGDLRRQLDLVYQRAVERYPSERRAIAAVEMPFGPDGRYHINVASLGRAGAG